MTDVYLKLRQRLDDLASGFPATESGVELKLLEKLFTGDEAELFVKLSPLPEKPEDVAKRLDRDPEETAALLEGMAQKGLVFRLRKGGTAKYSAVPFVPGIFDFQIKLMDRLFARDMTAYFDEELSRTIMGHDTPFMRAVPIKRELVVQWPVAPYEDAVDIINHREVIAVAPCVCRTRTGLLGEGCGKPLETCFFFGAFAQYYVDNGMARFIDREEALKIIRANDEAGLVLQPHNSVEPTGMCCCCGDCCELLNSVKKQPVPAAAVRSNYQAMVDAEECAGCGTCLERCQMEAVSLEDDRATIDLNRCIGCGLCVTTCSTGALRLIKKPETERYLPPQSYAEMMMRLAVERNKNVFPKPQAGMTGPGEIG
jgi:electron transport complex protein RnfB